MASNVSPLTPEHRDRRNLIGPAQRVRYRIKPTSDSPSAPGSWAPLLRVGDVSVFVNAEASGDAWLVRDGKIQPLNVVDSQPGRFVVQVEAGPETTLVVPANAFNGWRVSIDGAPDLATSAFEGYVAIKAEAGEHTYEFSYKAPLLPLVLILGSLPWLLGILLAVWGLWSVAQYRAQVSTSGNDHSISPEVAPLPFGPKS